MSRLWWGQAKGLVEAGSLTRKEIAEKLGVTYDTLRVALKKMGLTGVGKVGKKSPPAWHLMARDLLNSGEPATVAAKRCGVTIKQMDRFIRLYMPKPRAEDEPHEKKPRQKSVKKAPPVAGEVHKPTMDAAHAYARGEIDRDEMMRRLGKKPPPDGVFAERIL